MGLRPNYEELKNLQYELEGTCDNLEIVLERLGLDHIDIDSAEDQLIDAPHPVECCSVCGWWWSVGDMNEFVCSECERNE